MMLALMDLNAASPPAVWASLRLGYGMRRIPRKVKKRLLREWLAWRIP